MSFDDGVVAGQVLNVVSLFLGQLRVAHGKLSCRKGRMLLHPVLVPLCKVCPSNPLLEAAREKIKHFLRKFILFFVSLFVILFHFF